MIPNILIVDDEVNIQTSLARRYKLKGYHIVTANDGREALDLLEKRPFQIVISDIKMPVMDGVELLKKIRIEFPMTRVIMMTGYVTLDNGLACLRHGADTCIFKPFEDLNEMDCAVDNALKYLEHWEKKLLFLKKLGSE